MSLGFSFWESLPGPHVFPDTPEVGIGEWLPGGRQGVQGLHPTMGS